MTQTTFDFVKENIAVTPYHKWLKPELLEVNEEAGTVTIGLKNREELCREEGRLDLHGGIISALVDITGHAAICSKVLHNVATIDLRVDYLRLAGGPEFKCKGRIVKLGRTIGIVDIEIFDVKEKLVAIGRTSYVTMKI